MPPAPDRPPIDEAYVAFLLDAFARFEAEGRRIRPMVTWIRSRGRKPAHPVLTAVVRGMRSRLGPDALVAEFGVYKGGSINHLAGLLPRTTIHGFDSFEGFPEDGRGDWRHDFRLPALPKVRGNVKLVPGMFADTLPAFDLALPTGKAFDLVHMDCDIYTSARQIFDLLGHRIQQGTVIVFDELVNYDKFASNEFLAFHEFLTRRGLDFRWLVKVGNLRPLADYATPGPRRLFKDYRRLGWYQNAAVEIVADHGRNSRISSFSTEAAHLMAMPDFRAAHSPRAGAGGVSPA